MTAIITRQSIAEQAAEFAKVQCPTDLELNAKFRKKVRERGDNDPEFAKVVWGRCENDPVFWFNTFVVTQNPKDTDSGTADISGLKPNQLLTPELVRNLPDKIGVGASSLEVPMILFPRQMDLVRTIDLHVEYGRPLLLEKSREQGASVIMANYCAWRWTFKENANIKIGSMKKELVDGASFADQIMPKFDFALQNMPDWIKPPGYTADKPYRTFMQRVNPVTGRVIRGEGTNKHFAVSGRYALVWLDECAKIETLDSIHRKVANTTNCFIYTTTPEGYEFFAALVESGNFPVFRLHWTDNYIWHPKDSKKEECDWKNGAGGTWPDRWKCVPGCKFHADGGQPHSERYDRECAKLSNNPKDVAQELDISYAKSGNAVFNQDKVMKSINHLRNNPVKLRYYKLEFDKPAGGQMAVDLENEEDAWYELAKDWGVIAKEVAGGPLSVYMEPFSCRNPKCKCSGSGYHTYVLGGDTAKNVDGDYDCAYILDITSGEVVAEWHGRLEVKKLGKEWAKLCKWYGCATIKQAPPAWAAIEWNEFGVLACETMEKLGILLHVSRSEHKIKNKRGQSLGIVVSWANKGRLINDHLLPEINNGTLEHPDFPRLYCPFVDFWVECSTFVNKTADGTVRPDKAKMGAQSRSQHDDRVMAMMCAVYGAKDRYMGHVRDYLETDGSYGGMVQEQKLVPANPHPLLQDRNFGRDRQDTAA